jgi:iron complex transport system permease protein
MLGEDQGNSLGIRVQFSRNLMLILGSIITSVSVAYTGVIAFVGLIIPHMVRLVIGADNRKLIPLSFFSGAIFLLLSDTLARVIISPAEIRVGLITSFLGAPFFIYLLVSNRKNFYSL